MTATGMWWVCMIHVHLVVGNDAAPLQRLWETFRFPQLPHEGHTHDARTCCDRNADLQPGVSPRLHVLFPFGIASKTGFPSTRITGPGGPALGAASDGEPPQQLAIEADVKLLWPSHPLEVTLILPLETDFNHVFAFDRKLVANGHAATRPKREIFVLAVVLQQVQRDLECIEPGPRGRKTRGQPRDLTGHRKVSLQVGR